jgi:hypothetical protein
MAFYENSSSRGGCEAAVSKGVLIRPYVNFLTRSKAGTHSAIGTGLVGVTTFLGAIW